MTDIKKKVRKFEVEMLNFRESYENSVRIMKNSGKHQNEASQSSVD